MKILLCNVGDALLQAVLTVAAEVPDLSIA